VEVTAEHKFRCRCVQCLERKRAERAFLMISNKRDTYSELSWISKPHKWRERFLTWAWTNITNKDWKNHYFWSHEAERKSLESWLEDWLEDDKTVDTLASSQRLLSGKQF